MTLTHTGTGTGTPVLHVLAGPNGAGKSTLATRALQPQMHPRLVNADVIAARHWPDDQSAHAYDAARLAEAERRRLIFAGSRSSPRPCSRTPPRCGWLVTSLARGARTPSPPRPTVRAELGISPAQLAMVLVLAFVENLTDRHAADAVRTRPPEVLPGARP